MAKNKVVWERKSAAELQPGDIFCRDGMMFAVIRTKIIDAHNVQINCGYREGFHLPATMMMDVLDRTESKLKPAG